MTNGEVFLDFPDGSLIEAKRFVLSLGRFGKALDLKELVKEMGQAPPAMKGGCETLVSKQTADRRTSTKPGSE